MDGFNRACENSTFAFNKIKGFLSTVIGTRGRVWLPHLLCQDRSHPFLSQLVAIITSFCSSFNYNNDRCAICTGLDDKHQVV